MARRSLWLLVACAVVAVAGGLALGDRLPPPDIALESARVQQRGEVLDLRSVLGGRAKDGTRFQLWFTLQAADANDVTWRSNTVTGSFERDAQQVVEAQEQVQVPPGEQIGFDKAKDAKRFVMTPGGVIVIPSDFKFE